MIDLYDSELLKIEEIQHALQRSSEGLVDRDAWNREAAERFAEIGLKIDVKWWRTDMPDVLAPDIEIVGRLTVQEFDHARMAHEVQHDVLGTGEGGVMNLDGSSSSPKKVF